MLRHRIVRVLRAPLTACLQCLTDPEGFLAASRYTFTVKKVGPDLYEVVFKWRKFGITRYYKVKFRVRREGDRVIYESTPDSDYPMKFEFRLGGGDDSTRVEVYSEMAAGIMADLLGRKDYASFIEELVDKGLVGFARRVAQAAPTRPQPSEARCDACMLYEASQARCLLTGQRVADPSRPPCRGEGFVPAALLKEVAGKK